MVKKSPWSQWTDISIPDSLRWHDVLNTVSLDNAADLISPDEGSPFQWPIDEPHLRKWTVTRARRN